MSLIKKLDKLREQSESKMPQEAKEVMHRVTEELNDLEFMRNVLNAGDPAPAINLPNSDGKLMSSSDLLVTGPLVVTFYRGVW